jgi:uncharacterized protein YyaL (SSP411 family)
MSKTRATDTQLRWMQFYAPWCARNRLWRQQVEEQMQATGLASRMKRVDVPRDEAPETDQAAQTLLQTLSGQSGWPCNLFLAPDGTPVFAAGALEPQAFVKLLRQLLDAWDLSPEELLLEGGRQGARLAEQDPLRWERLPQSVDAAEQEQLLSKASLQRLLTPLEQSLDFERGWIGQAAQGTVFHAPGIYRALLAFEDLRKWGELALVRLARSPACDVLGGGFFRTVDAQGPATEKLAIENAELLEAYLDAARAHKRGFLVQVAHECLEFLMGPVSEASALDASPEHYLLAPADLLEALSGTERQAAQLFFGIEKGARVPELATEVEVLAPFLQLEPVDLHLQLLSSRRKLRAHRDKARAASRPAVQAATALSEWTSIRALARASFELDQPQAYDLARIRADRALERFEVRGPRARWARARAWLALARVAANVKDTESARTLIARVEQEVASVESPWEAISYETSFAGKRADLCDFVGASAASLYIETLLDLRGLQRQGIEGPLGLPVSARDSLALFLKAARPLGVHAASLYAALARTH